MMASVGIACTPIEREVCGEVELPGQVNDGVRADAILPGVDVLERRAVARIAVPRHIRREAEGMLAKRKTDFWREGKRGGTNNRP